MKKPEPRNPNQDKNKWRFVDIRLNPDGTFDLMFQPRDQAVPTPLWIDENGEKCANFEAHYKYPIPYIDRYGITDMEKAIKHAKIFDMYFGARDNLQEPDYGELMDYLKSIAPKAWEELTEVAAGRKKHEDTIAMEQTLRKERAKREAKELELEGERIEQEKPVKKKNPTKTRKNVGKEKSKKKYSAKRSQMSIF